MRDRIVLGVRESETRKCLLRQTKLTLHKCIEIVKSDEVSNTQMKKMNRTTKTEDVHKLQSGKPKRPEQDSREKKSRQTGQKYADQKPGNGRKPGTDKPCIYCGRKDRRVKPTVLRGDVFVEHVARGTISQANVKRKKKLTDLKKVIHAMRNFFIV